jgi:hypothetical protein
LREVEFRVSSNAGKHVHQGGWLPQLDGLSAIAVTLVFVRLYVWNMVAPAFLRNILRVRDAPCAAAMNLAKPLASVLTPILRNRPTADRALCYLLRQRLTLPSLTLSDLFDDFDDQPVTLRKMPRGSWSTPTQDIVMLLKLALCTKPRRLLEVGSFRGYTALCLAQNIGGDATIVTVDRYPEHGEAYRQTEEAARIERRVGETSPGLFAGDAPASYDLIFIDADHTYEGVRHDTELLLPLLSGGGYIAWHDYANWGYFNGYNGVPEYLKELSDRLPLAGVQGSDLAIYSPAWSVKGSLARDRYLSALSGGATSDVVLNPWSMTALR